jgi:hypothetical protein
VMTNRAMHVDVFDVTRHVARRQRRARLGVAARPVVAARPGLDRRHRQHRRDPVCAADVIPGPRQAAARARRCAPRHRSAPSAA